MIRGRRWSRGLWLVTLAALVLSLALQPVLASIGELHELAHDPTGRHVHVEHDVAAAELAADDGGESGAAVAFHSFLHFAHCCGHSVAAATSFLDVPHLAPGDPNLPLARAQVIPSAHSLAPFRPPISA